MNLAEVIAAAANPEQVPARRQVVVVDGHERLMLVCLDRTAVVEIGGERCLVTLDRIDVRDPASLRWQPREEAPKLVKRQGLAPAKSKGSGAESS